MDSPKETSPLTVDVLITCSLILTAFGNLISTVVLIRHKRNEERAYTDRKVHVLVLCCAIEVTNVLGSPLVYSLWIAADKANKTRNEFIGSVPSDTLCTSLRFLLVLWITCIVWLYIVVAGDRCYIMIRPFEYVTYARNKETLIPYFITSGCVALADSTAIVSALSYPCSQLLFVFSTVTTAIASVTAAENPLADHNSYTSGFHCILPPPSEERSGLVIFQLSLGFFAFSLMFASFVIFLMHFVKDMTNSTKIKAFRGGGKPVSSIPPGFLSNGSMIVMALVSWTPFLVVQTLREFSHVPNMTLVYVTFGMLFVPALLGPLVRYLTVEDYRKVWNDTLKRCIQCLSLK